MKYSDVVKKRTRPLLTGIALAKRRNAQSAAAMRRAEHKDAQDQANYRAIVAARCEAGK